MVENDPEMQQLVQQHAEAEPQRKPIWWQIALGAAGLAGAAATTGLVLVLGWGFHPVIPATGLFAGSFLVIAILGMWPGRYRIIETDEKLTMWTPLKPPIRALCAAGAVLAPVVGIALHLATLPDKPADKPSAPSQPAKATPAKPGKK